MVATRTNSVGVNESVIREKHRPGEFLISEHGAYHCRENATVDGGVSGVENNSVLIDGADAFVGIVFEGVAAGKSALRGILVCGPAEVSLARLVFPIVTDAVDGVDAGTDTDAENVAATTALKTALNHHVAGLHSPALRRPHPHEADRHPDGAPSVNENAGTQVAASAL